MIRFFHTRITSGKYQPIGLSGSVSLAPSVKSNLGIFPEGLHFEDVKGVKLDVAFLENNYRDCRDLKGYQYMGV